MSYELLLSRSLVAGSAALSIRSFLVVSSSLTTHWTHSRISTHYGFEYSLTCEGEENSRRDLGLRFRQDSQSWELSMSTSCWHSCSKRKQRKRLESDCHTVCANPAADGLARAFGYIER